MQPILIINSAPFTQEFTNPIIEFFKSKNIAFKTVSYLNLPSKLDNYSGIIISASPKGDDIIDEQLPIFQWLKTHTKPVLGSCHGHQLMGMLFGSSLYEKPESEEGMCDIQFLQQDNLLNNLANPLLVEQHHIKSISMPKNFIHLAKSDNCRNQIMRHKTLPLYGCQFHIEHLDTLLLNFSLICKQSL